MTTVADIRAALETALRQWRFYSETEADDDLATATHAEGLNYQHAARVLASLPTDGVILSREDAEFAAAWDAVEAHPGWRVERLVHAPEEAPLAPDWWRAAALTESHAPLCWAEGPTPTAALQALIEKLVQS